jgi:hypothetical protein
MEHLTHCIGATKGAPGGGGGSSTGDSERHMSRMVLEMEHCSLCRGSVRGTWREGSYTEDSERQVTEGSGNSAFLFIDAP